jgi:hypothetical protein
MTNVTHAGRFAPTHGTVHSDESLAHQAYQLLHWGFVAAPFLAGADKFFGFMTHWECLSSGRGWPLHEPAPEGPMNEERTTSETTDELAPAVDMTRRHLLVLGVSALSLLAAAGCKKGPPVSCSDVSALTPDEINVRNMLAYTDQSPETGKSCSVCQQYNAPPSIDQCGSCKILKGPVHPNGYCKSFLAKTT